MGKKFNKLSPSLGEKYWMEEKGMVVGGMALEIWWWIL